MSTSDNAAILASALTSLTGSQVITQSDYLHRSSIDGNKATYLNINPVSLHNSYLAGSAVSNVPQQNNDVSNSFSSYTGNHENGNVNHLGNVNQQQYFHIPNPQIIPRSIFSPQSASYPTSITNPNN